MIIMIVRRLQWQSWNIKIENNWIHVSLNFNKIRIKCKSRFKRNFFVRVLPPLCYINKFDIHSKWFLLINNSDSQKFECTAIWYWFVVFLRSLLVPWFQKTNCYVFIFFLNIFIKSEEASWIKMYLIFLLIVRKWSSLN